MVKVQTELSDKANKTLERYIFYNGAISKAQALNEILEHYDINGDFQDWLKRESDSNGK